MNEKMDASQLKELDKDFLVGLILEQNEQIKDLRGQVQSLKEQLAKNSRNSSKPPSSDGVKKPKPKSLREKGQRKTGGQVGHEGKTLLMVATPDEFVRYELAVCPQCQADLSTSPIVDVEKRQVFDIPALGMVVTEHQAEVKVCACCGVVVKASFPKQIAATVQYGERIKAQIAYLSSYQLLPIARLTELIGDFYGQSVSEDTVCGILANLSDAVEPSLQAIQAQLVQADVLHGDETSLRVAGQTQWLHVLSSVTLTYYALHSQRGQAALRAIGLVPQFVGYFVHDAYASYFVFDRCCHVLCNAHILRELTFLFEEQGQAWAAEFKNLLMTMKQAVADAQSQHRLEPEQVGTFIQSYTQLLALGRQTNPHPEKPLLPKRGRLKQSPAQNLLHRLEQYQEAVLAFIHDFRVPFDNNLAERDLRMMKVKQKISGAFRTVTGAETFARLRSYISTVRKQSGNVLDALSAALLGRPFMPSAL